MCRRLVGSAKDSGGWAVTRTGFTTCDRNCCVMHGVMSLAHNSIVPKGKGMHDLGPWRLNICIRARPLMLACTWFNAFSTRFTTQVHACGQSRPVGCTYERCYWIPFLLQLFPWLNISSTPIYVHDACGQLASYTTVVRSILSK
jgi:hypothetical protein